MTKKNRVLAKRAKRYLGAQSFADQVEAGAGALLSESSTINLGSGEQTVREEREEQTQRCLDAVLSGSNMLTCGRLDKSKLSLIHISEPTRH